MDHVMQRTSTGVELQRHRYQRGDASRSGRFFDPVTQREVRHANWWFSKFESANGIDT